MAQARPTVLCVTGSSSRPAGVTQREQSASCLERQKCHGPGIRAHQDRKKKDQRGKMRNVADSRRPVGIPVCPLECTQPHSRPATRDLARGKIAATSMDLCRKA